MWACCSVMMRFLTCWRQVCLHYLCRPFHPVQCLYRQVACQMVGRWTSGSHTAISGMNRTSELTQGSDHGDFEGRIRGIYHQFGPDNSALDRNSGHGTHVTATLLGDGSGDMSALGMVPAASFHFYQLEVDSSGLLARWGSLYDMFTHTLGRILLEFKPTLGAMRIL